MLDDWEPGVLGSSPSSVFHEMCDLVLVTRPFWSPDWAVTK